MGVSPCRGVVVVIVSMRVRMVITKVSAILVMRVVVANVIVVVSGVTAALRVAGRWSVRSAAVKARPLTHSNRRPMRMIRL